jgi:hypothetical protein
VVALTDGAEAFGLRLRWGWSRCLRWLSAVIRPALRPYLVEFAIATASSASATGCATSTGPNVSSVWMRAPAGTSARTVGR